MADVNIIPKIQCDNCGLTVDKVKQGNGASTSYHKPTMWGSCKIEGGRATDEYGGKSRLTFVDLCQSCANAAVDAAAAALKAVRKEQDDD